MNRYQHLYRKFLGVAFIVGPLLWFVGSLFMPLGWRVLTESLDDVVGKTALA